MSLLCPQSHHSPSRHAFTLSHATSCGSSSCLGHDSVPVIMQTLLGLFKISFIFEMIIQLHHFSLPIPLSKPSHIPLLSLFQIDDLFFFNWLLLYACMYITCSVCTMLLVCMFSVFRVFLLYRIPSLPLNPRYLEIWSLSFCVL